MIARSVLTQKKAGAEAASVHFQNAPVQACPVPVETARVRVDVHGRVVVEEFHGCVADGGGFRDGRTQRAGQS